MKLSRAFSQANLQVNMLTSYKEDSRFFCRLKQVYYFATSSNNYMFLKHKNVLCIRLPICPAVVESPGHFYENYMRSLNLVGSF